MPIILNGTTFNNGGTVTFNGSPVKEIKFGSTTVWKAEFILFENGRFKNGVTNTFKYGNKHSINGNYLRLSTNEGTQSETNTIDLRTIANLSDYTKLVFVKYDGGYCRAGLSNSVGAYGTAPVKYVDTVAGTNTVNIANLDLTKAWYLSFTMNNSTCRFSKIYLA